MGKANLENISKFFINYISENGPTSICDCTTALYERGETLHASEGEYDDLLMLEEGVIMVIEHFTQDPSVIIPTDMDDEQTLIFEQWTMGGEATWETEQYQVFDKIRWTFHPDWYYNLVEVGHLTYIEN